MTNTIGPANTRADCGSGRRWAIAALITLVAVVSTYNQFLIAAIGPQVMTELDIGNVELSSLITAPMLCGVILAVPGGTLGDRFGVKLVVGIALSVSVVGAVARTLADSYPLFFAATFTFGIAALIASTNAAKLLGAWFGPLRMGPAMGLFMAAGPIGTTLGQLTGAHYPDTRSAYIVGAGLFVVVLVLWVALVRNVPPDSARSVPTSLRNGAVPHTPSLLGVLSNHHVWLIGIGMMLYMGSQITYSSFITTALNVDRGVSLASAGALASLFTIGSLLGSVVAPLIVARVGLVRPVGAAAMLLAAGLMVLTWFLAPGELFPILLFLSGMAVSSIAPLIMSAPALLPSVGPADAGAAGGIINTMLAVGTFAVPTLIIIPIAGGNYTVVFCLAALCAALICVVMLVVPEYGPRAVRRSEPPENAESAVV